MRKRLFFSIPVLFLMLLTSCNKEMGALDPSLFRVNPNPLVAKGGKVEAVVTGQFPEKYFNKNAVVKVTPVLRFADSEISSKSEVFQGEKVIGNDKQVMYKAGGNYSIKAAFDYFPAMNKSELFLDIEVTQKGKTYQLPSVKVADGVLATSELISTEPTEVGAALIPDKFQRIIKETQEADIMFLIQQSTLRSSETSSSDVVALTQKIKEAKDAENLQVAGLEVSAYASPDGGYKLNENLSKSRQDVTVNYLNREIKKLKTSVNIDSKFTAQDWEGFQKLMENSNIQDKQVILRVLSMYDDPEQREREIKNLSVAYKNIADEILPKLRRSRLQLIVDIIGKTDEEITRIAKANPSELTVDELLYAATLTTNVNEKIGIYKKAVELFPKDVRGYNNLGLIYYNNNMPDAKNYFEQALKLVPNSPDVNYNLGLLSMAAGEVDKATEYFGKAAGTTGSFGQALGTLYVKKGDYEKAKSSFSNASSNNAALTQILSEDYNAARRTLSGISAPDATTAYLTAIVAARTNDRDAVYTNLRTAVQRDSSYASRAATDLEFAKYFADSVFKSIVQ
ncbi:MAG: tetratricopeptide repeat protein [Prevotellaceae bacterium]|jgi:tetratricopeptide (TPR) repeat protein|nr:tetratricopeptide repeat protein [Prevotellaceae bacterium]